MVSLERSKPEVAADLLKKVLQKSPDSPEVHYQLGRAEAQLGDNDAAAANFRFVVGKAEAADAEILRQSYYQLAQVYRRMQRPEESQVALNTFLRLKKQADVQEKLKLEDKLKRAGQEAPQ